MEFINFLDSFKNLVSYPWTQRLVQLLLPKFLFNSTIYQFLAKLVFLLNMIKV